MTPSITTESAPCFGHCQDCGRTHRLPFGNARTHADRLMLELEEIRRLDYLSPASETNPRMSFAQLLPGERGHMFGVLECLDAMGRTVVLRAFSSLHGGVRDLEGWVPQILSQHSFYSIVLPGLDEIKRMTRELEQLPSGCASAEALTEERTRFSRDLWREMQTLYFFHNFRGQSRSLRDAFFPTPTPMDNITSGVGECCAPKLLNHAARRGLRPVGLAEFYWGGSNKSGTRKSGEFYSCCATRCQPILGFMLCGLENDS